MPSVPGYQRFILQSTLTGILGKRPGDLVRPGENVFCVEFQMIDHVPVSNSISVELPLAMLPKGEKYPDYGSGSPQPLVNPMRRLIYIRTPKSGADS